jgi:predicted NBD/HSP70 family sugar kinase
VRFVPSLKSLRDLNRLRIVDTLRTQVTASRADIVTQTGLSRSTVSTLVGDLIDAGVLVEQADPSWQSGQQGRPPVLLSLNPSAGAAVGVDFDHDKIRVAVSDLSREVLAESVIACDVDHDAIRALDIAADEVRRLLEQAGRPLDAVVGVGMALAGPVDHDRGVLHFSTILPGWLGVDAAAELERRLGVPVRIDNDANLGALAEVTLGAGRQARNAAYIQISSGIGAGLIVDGLPYRGFAGMAGEIGHVVVDESGPICRCGNRGCLETFASGPALARLLEASRGETVTIPQVIALAEAGDAGARRAIADAGRTIGKVVAVLCNIFNPEMVVVGGDLGAAGELLVGPLRESLERASIPATIDGLQVVAGELGDRANLLGALALAIAESEHPMVARMAPQAGAA